MDDSHEPGNDEQILYTKKTRRERVAGGGEGAWEGKLPCMVSELYVLLAHRQASVADVSSTFSRYPRQQQSSTRQHVVDTIRLPCTGRLWQEQSAMLLVGRPEAGYAPNRLRGSSESRTESQQMMPSSPSSVAAQPTTPQPASRSLSARLSRPALLAMPVSTALHSRARCSSRSVGATFSARSTASGSPEMSTRPTT